MRTALLLFVYNRPRHTARTLEALVRNRGAEGLDLLVFSDGPASQEDVGKVTKVRALCRSIRGFGSVEYIERVENLGLAGSIRAGVSEALARYDAVGVLEDDLVTSPYFLTYLFGALEAYQTDERLLSVSAYMPPRLLMPRSRRPSQDVWLSVRNLSYGWGIWKDRWQSVQWDQAAQENLIGNPELQNGFAGGGADLPVMMEKQLKGETDSWAIHLSYAHFRQQRFSLLPMDSYVRPVGLDGSGVHCRPSPVAWCSTVRHAVEMPEFPQGLEVDLELKGKFRLYYDRQFRVARWLGRV